MDRSSIILAAPRGWMAAAFLAIAGALLAALPSSARAEGDVALELKRTIVTERRIADDRESELIRQQDEERRRLEVALATARRGGTAAKTRAISLARQLAETEKREKALLNQILQRDPASKILVADLETGLAQLSATASTKLKPSLAKYGAGKRTEAWPAIEALTRDGTPREKRIAAQLRQIMFNDQDPGVTAEDVRLRWKAAVDADPSNALALTSLATAEQYVGHVNESLALLAQAATAATTSQERYVIALQRANAAYALQDPEVMAKVTRDLIGAIHELSGADVADASRKWLEAQATVSLAAFLVPAGKLDEAADYYARASDMFRQLQAEAPTWRFIDDALAAVLFARARIESQLYRGPGALQNYAEATAILEKRVAASPTDAAVARASLSQAYSEACGVEVALKHNEAALALCTRALANEKLAPQSAFRDFRLATGSVYLGRLMGATGRLAEAKEQFRYSIEKWKQLVALQAVPPNLAGYADAMSALASVDETTCWREVAAAWDALKETSELTTDQRRARVDARIRGRAGQGCDLAPPASRIDRRAGARD